MKERAGLWRREVGNIATPHRMGARAFTLAELLAVIAIIGVLSALAFPTFGHIRNTADDTKCVSNFRQIGSAIASYAIDHNEYLPGPVLAGQAAWFKTNDSSLASYLAKYLSLTPIQSWPAQPNPYTCPAFQRTISAGSTPMYEAESIYDAANQTIARPWGYPSTLTWNSPPLAPGVVNLPVLRMSEAASAIDPTNGAPISMAKQVALHDIDQTEFKNSSYRPGWLNSLPVTPVHGDHQNALFFDWHVGRINPVTQLPM